MNKLTYFDKQTNLVCYLEAWFLGLEAQYLSGEAVGRPVISDDVIFYAPTSPEPMKGFGGYMGVLAMMRGAMPDIKWQIEETISEGDKILVRYTMTGTQTQPLMGMPATGRQRGAHEEVDLVLGTADPLLQSLYSLIDGITFQ
ncbi:MAG: ester cyclase [Prevotella sp.]|nr:ester cyclase [Prevotella sp.]